MRLLIAFCAWVLAAAISDGASLTAKELLSLDGDEFRAKASFVTNEVWEKFTGSELTDIANRWAKELKGKTGDFNQIYPFEGLFSVACRKAGSAELDRLIDAYLVLGNEAEAPEYLFPLVADACIKRELKAIKREHVRLALPKVTEELPTELRQAPLELQEAWISYKAAQADFKANFARARGHAINYEQNEKAFADLLGSVLKGDGKGDSEKLFRFFSSNDSIVVGSGFDVWRARALLLALLKERRLSETVGAALNLRLVSPTVGSEENKSFDPIVDVLPTLGLAWEKTTAGAQLDLRGNPFESSRPVFLDELAAFGTDRAANLMILLAGQAEEENRPAYASAIRLFIADGKQHSASVEADEGNSEELVIVTPSRAARVSKVRISEKLQKQLLGILVEWAKPDVSNELGEELVRALVSTSDRLAVGALRQLCAHPSHEVAEEAATRLKRLGEKPPVIAKSEPVRFRVLVNGKPLPTGSNIDWRVEYEDRSPDVHTSDSGSGTVDEHSWVSIDRDKFVGPQQKAVNVSLEGGSYRSLDAPCFRVTVPVATDLSKVTTVPVELIPLTITFDAASLPAPRRCAEVTVTLAPNAGGQLFPRYEKTGPCAQNMTLLAQGGTYTVTARATGAATWESKVNVSKEFSSILIPLHVGSDVHLAVLKPKGGEAHGEILFQNGAAMDRQWRDEKGTYRGLPSGSYLIHIPSSNERREIFPGESAEAGPDEVDYAGRDLAVAVGENSPPVIDLGEIRLEPVNR